MSQGILSVASGSGATVRAGFNAALARLATKASGTARPSDIAAGEDWLETDNPGGGIWSWWFYDGASDILLGTVNSSTHGACDRRGLAQRIRQGTCRGELHRKCSRGGQASDT